MPYVGQTITEVFPTSISVDTATISGNTTIGGTLGVTGASTLSGTLGVTGVSTLSDNIVFGASGKGVHLGVTSATASNLIDDYEEGTWTPTVTGSSSGSYALDAGHKSTYIKVGNICHISTSFGLGTLTGTASGFIVIAGLPFNYNGGVSQSTGACFLSRANLASTHKQTHIMQSSSGTANTFFLPFMRDNDTSGESDLSIFSSSSNITFSFSYQTV